MWLIEILKIYSEEQLLIKHYAINHLILIRIQNMMDTKEVLLQCFTKILIKNSLLRMQINLLLLLLTKEQELILILKINN